ncbi:MAG: peptide ABC transporter substrate-binding protein [Oscillospiraceae bacterium]|nr:peptide ABC transporter substrate-binding protein [Oscillospiraceae bacterium]
MIRRLCAAAAAVLCGVFCLSGCSRKENTGAGFQFTCTLESNPGCLDPQYTDNPYAAAVLANTMEGLMRLDAAGNPVCAEAKSYAVSKNGLHYTFTLRDDCYWYNADTDPERADRVTAKDYVFAFKRLVDPGQYSPFAEDFACIRNAAAITAGDMGVDALGVNAPDATTLEIELAYPEPDFLSLLARSCAVPCSQHFFESTDGRYGLNDKTILCNGPFYLTKWVYDQYGGGNFITCRRNKLYYDKDAVFPSNLQFNIMHSREEAVTDFAEGSSDIFLTDTYPKEYAGSKDYVIQSYRAETLGLIFNQEKARTRNEDFRQALARSIDRSAMLPELSEDMTAAYGVIPPGVTLLGRSFRELYADEQTALPYQPEYAKELFNEADKDLGLRTSTMQILIPSTVLDTEALLSVCQGWQDLFGYYIGIETVSPEEFDRRIASGDYSIALWGLKPDTNSCDAVLTKLLENCDMLGTSEEAYAAYAAAFAAPGKAAQRSDSIALYGEAEKTFLESACFIPLLYKNTYLVTTDGNEDVRYDPFTGAVYLREAKHFQ